MKKFIREYFVLTLLALTAVAGMGCGQKEEAEKKVEFAATQEASTEEDVVAADVASTEESSVTAEETTTEESAVTSPFMEDLEKYDSIISTLSSNQYYAFAGIAEDYDALLVADGVFDNGDGNMVAIDAKVYGIGDDGVIYEAGSVWSDGTAYPLAVYDNTIMFGDNHRMTMAYVENASVYIKKDANEVFDEQGNVTYSYNEGDIDDIRTVEDDSVLSEMFEAYEKAVVVNFFQAGN